jgi:hypothetical protein
MFWHQIATTNLLQRINNVGSVSFVLLRYRLRENTLLVKNQAAAMIEAMYEIYYKRLKMLLGCLRNYLCILNSGKR